MNKAFSPRGSADKWPLSHSFVAMSPKTPMAIFYIQYEATPDWNPEDFQTCGGAFIGCWVRAESKIEAQKLTFDAIRENGWTILAVEEECREVNEHWYLENDEGREYYEQCVSDGECYVFHMWPVEPQEQDDVH